MKIYIFLNILILFSLSSYHYTYGKEIENNKKHQLNISASGSFNKTTNDVINIYNSSLSYGYNVKKQEFNAGVNWIYGSKTAGLSNNDVSVTVDGNHYFDKKNHFNGWILGNFTSSYSLNIRSRYQLGAGVAYKLNIINTQRYRVDKENNDTTKYNNKLILRLSNGIIFEESDIYTQETGQEYMSIFRNSLRVQLESELWRRLTVKGTMYWQPSLQNFSDYNIISNLSLGFILTQHIRLDTKFAYNYISSTSKENLIITYGIGATYKF